MEKVIATTCYILSPSEREAIQKAAEICEKIGRDLNGSEYIVTGNGETMDDDALFDFSDKLNMLAAPTELIVERIKR